MIIEKQEDVTAAVLAALAGFSGGTSEVTVDPKDLDNGATLRRERPGSPCAMTRARFTVYP